MRQEMAMLASVVSRAEQSAPKNPMVAPAYAVMAAAMLFMCRPGTKPEEKPMTVPNADADKTERMSPSADTTDR